MKIVINSDFGGFSLSKAAYNELGIPWDEFGFCTFERSDPRLVSCIEKLGSAANGKHAELKIVEIPDDIEWEIERHEGKEWVAEKHRTWE
jgi:hypothetical protein